MAESCMLSAYYLLEPSASTVRIHFCWGTPHAMDRFAIGMAVRQAREARGLTLREVAAATGLSFAYIQQIESPRPMTNVTTKALAQLLPALGLDLVVVTPAEVPAANSVDPARRDLVRRAALALAQLPDDELEQEARILELRAARYVREPAAPSTYDTGRPAKGVG